MDLSKLPDKELINLKNGLEVSLFLENTKKNFEEPEQMELVYASLGKNAFHCFSDCSNCNKCKDRGLIMAEQTVINPPEVQKITCSLCGHNFEKSFVPGQMNEIKCPNCFAILDSSGKMLYPPQVRNFELSCSQCQARNNWLILKDEDDYTQVKCLSCSSEYKIKFKDYGIKSKYIQMLTALKTVSVRCLQCGNYNERNLPSTQQIIDVKCKKCGLSFSFDTSHKAIKEIESIVKIEPKEDKSDLITSIEKEDKKEEKQMFTVQEEMVLDENVVEELDKDEIGYELVDAKKMSYEEKKGLPDSSFAVIVTVKNKVTGEPRKIRKYPIHDEAHVRNALARLGQDAPRAELQKLGIDPETVINKVLRRARELGMKELLERRKAKGMEKSDVRKLLRKAVDKINLVKSALPSEVSKRVKELIKQGIKPADAVKQAWNEYKKEQKQGKRKLLRKAVAKIIKVRKEKELSSSALKEEIEKTKEFYLTNAKKVIERKAELGDFAKDLKDEEIINDDKFALVKAKKIIAEKEAQTPKPELKTASIIVADKGKEDQYAKNREKVNEIAYGHLNKK